MVWRESKKNWAGDFKIQRYISLIIRLQSDHVDFQKVNFHLVLKEPDLKLETFAFDR